MTVKLTQEELGQLTAALVAARSAYDALVSSDSDLDDFTRGYVTGAFHSVPKQLDVAMHVIVRLNERMKEGPEPPE